MRESVKLNDGKLWEVNVYHEEKELTITGEMLMDMQHNKYNNEIKVLKIKIPEANALMKKHCNNNPEKLIKFIKVNENDG